jgi:DNA topoisomerase-1
LIISTLLDRKYVDREERSLKPSELGITVNRILVAEFPDIFTVGFTADMEEDLDRIESGEKKRLHVLDGFYRSFATAVEKAMGKKEAIRDSLQEGQNEKCPKCGRELVKKWGRNGKFIACTGYPECKFTKPMEGETNQVQVTCEKCGSPMVVKNGRFGRFLACSTYPECKQTKPFSIGIACPVEGCTGEIIERKSGRGKLFYGCSRYPACTYATWYKPISKPCSHCRHPLMEEHFTKKQGVFLLCPKCKTKEFSEEQNESKEGSAA